MTYKVCRHKSFSFKTPRLDMKNCEDKNCTFLIHAIGATLGSYMDIAKKINAKHQEEQKDMNDLMEINATVFIK